MTSLAVPLHEHRIHTAVGRLRYRTNASSARADGIDVVLVHGLVISIEYMMPFAERLAPLCRVWAVDLPGYGKSERPPDLPPTPELGDALAAWMEAVGLASANVLGNSYGCQIASEFAARHPARLDRLVLVGPTVDPDARSFLRQFPRWLRNAPREAPGMGRHMIRDYRRAGPRLIVQNVRNCLGHRIERVLPRISAPTLVVRGSNDPLVPQRWAEEARRLLPRGELRVIPGQAHTVNFSGPLELVRVVRPFLGLPRTVASGPSENARHR
jgi:pimeloyl-ACP methyl ester carboxylesterase